MQTPTDAANTAATVANTVNQLAPVIAGVVSAADPALAPIAGVAAATVQAATTAVDDIAAAKSKLLATFTTAVNTARTQASTATQVMPVPQKQAALANVFQKLDEAFLLFH